MTSSVAGQVRSFVVETFLFGDTKTPLPEDGSLIENGLIDSTGILELVAFVEETFEITVSDEEILPANFDSIAKVEAFVERKRAGSTASAAVAA
jgi:acyl carrier protein